MDTHLSLDSSSLPALADDPGPDTHDAEAALEALRAAIGHQGAFDPSDSGVGVGVGSAPTLAHHHHHDGSAYAAHGGDGGEAGAHTISAEAWEGLERALGALQGLQGTVESVVHGLEGQLAAGAGLGATVAIGGPGAEQGLRLVVESGKRMRDVVKGLMEQLAGGQIPQEPTFLTSDTVPRSQYDALKYRLDSLLAHGEAKKSKRRAVKKDTLGGHTQAQAGPSHSLAHNGHGHAHGEDPLHIDPGLSGFHDGTEGDIGKSREGSVFEADGRKRKRSIKLEHLIHQRANRLLGVEYHVSGFDVPGSAVLPDPESVPPAPHQSVSGVAEHRPEYAPDQRGRGVREYLDQVVQDVLDEWPRFEGQEGQVDREGVAEKVNVYWVRLCKRWDEQMSKARGEEHRDTLTRRKQNQYRRQQSLLARRQYAFDTSPLNLCKMRALYRNLLTIDYAAPTNEKPDPTRQYSDDEWHAYQKLTVGPRAHEAHEVVDIPWLSDTARALLNILDVYSADLSARQKRKGKPKTPAPTFHLPRPLWTPAASALPALRPKDADGLPVSDVAGLVIFRFAVSDEVARQFPSWAAGLYDNPPPSEDDAALPGLGEVLQSPVYAYLRPRIQREREKASPALMGDDEVQEALERAWVLQDEDGFGVGAAGAGAAGGTELDQAVAATQELLAQAAAAGAGAGVGGTGADPFGVNSNNAFLLSAHLGLPHLPQLASLLGNGGGMDGAGSGSVGSPGSASASASGLAIAGLGGLGIGAGGTQRYPSGPAPGSSLRARKVGKRAAAGSVVEGAATPVKRQRLGGSGAAGQSKGREGSQNDAGTGDEALEADAGALEGL